jgi:formylglycine-generating enzyme required for sulfatase activity
VIPYTLPLLEWVKIPGGKIVLGNGYGVFEVARFAIAKYPVTNAQFQAFLEDVDGYTKDEWWTFSPSAQAWHRDNPGAKAPYFTGDMLPRESVSWYEAMAFCRWLSYKMRLPVTLPTEMQWQRAAQGGDGRRYPWGKRYDVKKFNVALSQIKQTTPVDRYPAGKSPFGVFDMSGNVWEWCLNKFETPKDLDITGDSRRAIRGSSWEDSFETACAAFRIYSYPYYRLTSLGFRVATPI